MTSFCFYLNLMFCVINACICDQTGVSPNSFRAPVLETVRSTTRGHFVECYQTGCHTKNNKKATWPHYTRVMLCVAFIMIYYSVLVVVEQFLHRKKIWTHKRKRTQTSRKLYLHKHLNKCIFRKQFVLAFWSWTLPVGTK